jgi:hypothetical protein
MDTTFPRLLAQHARQRPGDAALRARLGAAGLARARTLYNEAKIVERQIALLESRGTEV